MTEIQRADPGRRHGVFVTAMACLVVGAILIAAFEFYQQDLDAWLADSPSESRIRFGIVLTTMAVLQCVPLLGLAVYLWILGRRVVRAHRFPLPGSLVIRDTPVLLDRDADRRGRILEAVAAGFGVAALGSLYVLWWLWSLVPA